MAPFELVCLQAVPASYSRQIHLYPSCLSLFLSYACPLGGPGLGLRHRRLNAFYCSQCVFSVLCLRPRHKDYPLLLYRTLLHQAFPLHLHEGFSHAAGSTCHHAPSRVLALPLWFFASHQVSLSSASQGIVYVSREDTIPLLLMQFDKPPAAAGLFAVAGHQTEASLLLTCRPACCWHLPQFQTISHSGQSCCGEHPANHPSSHPRPIPAVATAQPQKSASQGTGQPTVRPHHRQNFP